MSQDDVLRQIAGIAFDPKVDPPQALARIRDVIAEGVIDSRTGGDTRMSDDVRKILIGILAHHADGWLENGIPDKCRCHCGRRGTLGEFHGTHVADDILSTLSFIPRERTLPPKLEVDGCNYCLHAAHNGLCLTLTDPPGKGRARCACTGRI
jgi:hypothetical protein